MPTTKPRHMITENEELAAALDMATRIWPEDAATRTELLRKIIATGIETLQQKELARKVRRLDAIEKLAGSMPNVWGEDWREEQLEGWPE